MTGAGLLNYVFLLACLAFDRQPTVVNSMQPWSDPLFYLVSSAMRILRLAEILCCCPIAPALSWRRRC